jgi:hypothetical protein
MNRFALGVAMVVFASLSALGCNKEPEQKRYRVTFEVRVERAPAVGARLVIGGRPVKQTDAQGVAQLLLPGNDGTQYQVTVQCPPGTTGPASPITVTLRTLELADQAAAQRGIVQSVQCTPNERTLGVVVRTEGQSNIPIFWQNREVARTDQGGVAHLTFRVKPQTSVQLELRTTELPNLRPENPRQTFQVADADDIQTWDQTFQVQAPQPSVVRRPRRPAPVVHRITRIPSRSFTFR